MYASVNVRAKARTSVSSCVTADVLSKGLPRSVRGPFDQRGCDSRSLHGPADGTMRMGSERETVVSLRGLTQVLKREEGSFVRTLRVI